MKNLKNTPKYSNLIAAQYAALNERSGRSTLFLWYLPSGLVAILPIGFSLVVNKVLWIQGIFAFFLGLFSFIIFFGMHQNHFYLRKAIKHMRIIEGEIGLFDITDTPQTLKAKKTIGIPSKYLYFYGWLKYFILILAILFLAYSVWLY